ncbi:orientation disruptor isoform 2-T2 [Glossina fuscipes fuscipes]
MLNCEHVVLDFSTEQQQTNSLVYIVESLKECDVISTAIQLIYSKRYAELSSLHRIKHQIKEGKIIVKFSLSNSQLQIRDVNNLNSEDDNERPCTSTQARERELRRKQRCLRPMRQITQITAIRDFQFDGAIIDYTVNQGPTKRCSVAKFQAKFFSCADFILPDLTSLKLERSFKGKWFNILRGDCEGKGKNLLKDFGRMFVYRNFELNEMLAGLTRSTLMTSSSISLSKISSILRVFRDVRRIFEYITCSEYTVLFLLPCDCGPSKDITKIAQRINFEEMQTTVQLRVTGASAMPQIPWTQAESHIKELLLIAFQLAFAYRCHEHLVFLHSVKNLQRYQNLLVFNGTLAQKQQQRNEQNWFSKNYLQRIIDVCLKIGLSAVIEYEDNLPLPLQNAAIIQCRWQSTPAVWLIDIKKGSISDCNPLNRFVEVLNILLK